MQVCTTHIVARVILLLRRLLQATVLDSVGGRRGVTLFIFSREVSILFMIYILNFES
jgi:hypothetical protein